MFQNTKQRNIFWLTFALGLGWALYRLFTSNGYILDDEARYTVMRKNAIAMGAQYDWNLIWEQ